MCEQPSQVTDFRIFGLFSSTNPHEFPKPTPTITATFRIGEQAINHVDALHRWDQLFWLFYDCATNLSRGATEVCGEKDALQACPVRRLGICDVSLAEAVTTSDASDWATFL